MLGVSIIVHMSITGNDQLLILYWFSRPKCIEGCCKEAAVDDVYKDGCASSEIPR